MLKLCKIQSCASGALGLHLSRAPWDPYPWVSGIQHGSSAHSAGMRVGDTVLEMNGCDVLGQKIAEIAQHIRAHWQSGATYVSLVIWRNGDAETSGKTEADGEDQDAGGGTQRHGGSGINQQSLQKFATCLQHIAQLLECPVCLEVIKPPGWQCCNGHVLCNNCRSRSVKCPVCRVPLGPRGRCLLSDKLFTLLAESFPCDGVRSNSDSPTARRKCTPEYHNHPKMAAATMQQHQPQQQQQRIRTKECSKNRVKPTQPAKQEEIEGEEEKRAEKVSKNFGTAVEYEEGGRGQDAREITEVELQLFKGGSEENTESPTNAGSHATSIRLRCTASISRTSQRVHQHRQLDELKIPRSCVKVAGGHQQMSSDDDDKGSSSHVGDAGPETLSNGCRAAAVLVKTSPHNNVLVKLELKSSRKKSADYAEQPRAMSHESQDDEVATVNNGAPTNGVQHQQQHREQEPQQQYRNYHCPTGKSCCSHVEACAGTAATGGENKLSTTWASTQPNAAAAVCSSSKSTHAGSLSCNKSWTAASVRPGTLAAQPGQYASVNLPPPENQSEGAPPQCLPLASEWQVLLHLTQQHRLAVSHFYGTYGRRMHVDFLHGKSMACLNVAQCCGPADSHKVDKFFLACIPLDSGPYALFLWHLPLGSGDVRHFETVIESKCTGTKWFGRAHTLATSWAAIRAAGHFLTHEMPPPHESDAFNIVIKIK